MNKKAIVIGSGFGGIAVSLRLQKLGYETTIIEKLNELGGRARVFKVNGYKHDAGPTVINSPFYLMNYLVYLIKKGKPSLSLFHWNLGTDIISMMEKLLITVQQLKKQI